MLFWAWGGILTTSGGLLARLSSHPVLMYAGYAIALIGISLLAHGTFGIRPYTRLMDQWSPERLEKALTDAPPDATIRILQTSIPDVTRLIGLLEQLLVFQKKQFHLKVLLLDFEKAPDVLMARVRLRVETAHTHIEEIQANTEQLIRLKERVDAAWKDERSGAKLNLEIRYYTFLPFGSVFQIGEEHIFSGLFWNWTSSINGPMLVVADRSSNAWQCYEKHLSMGWEQARQVYPTSDTALSAPNGAN
jgi:hypothetical protein